MNIQMLRAYIRYCKYYDFKLSWDGLKEYNKTYKRYLKKYKII